MTIETPRNTIRYLLIKFDYNNRYNSFSPNHEMNLKNFNKNLVRVGGSKTMTYFEIFTGEVYLII